MANLTHKDLGEALGLDTDKNISLWKDRVALELNYAILQSFQVAGATIVDQFTVSDQFQTHMKNEMRERGGCPAGVLTSIFHIIICVLMHIIWVLIIQAARKVMLVLTVS